METKDTKAKKSYSVLIVDDDRFLLDMYTLKFTECGCAVEAISDPKAALEKLRGGAQPNIILLDVIMPALSGFEFLEIRKKENLAPNATVIMLTNQGQPEDVQKAMTLGAAGYIIKASSIPSEVLQQAFSIADGQKK